MSKDVYNLQIPISKELEAQLRELAEIDERTIRVFCRRILQKYVDENLGRLKDTQTTDTKDSYTPGEDVEGFDWSLDD
ncbi:MAG: hypothetical protein J6D47_08125 [Peptostreptococcaceae bacterium]|jgi:hypothetical protein|nr:hypothetical protein [Peptostreptococcaceae bacterium]